MQEGEGKVACKSDEIASTPTRGHSAEVTPRLTANKREQAKAKKIKQTKKKGLEGYFGTGACMPPPSLEGTPINAVGKRRGEEAKANDRKEGEGKSSLEPGVDGSKALPHMQPQPNEGGEGKQRGARTNSIK